MIASRQIAFGRGGKRFPYDAEVAYLESTGTQYINTGIMGASEWHITAQGAATPTTSNCVIATISSGGSFWGNYGAVNYWAVGNGSYWRCSLPYTSVGSFIVSFSASSVQFTVNGETVTRASAPNFSKAFYLYSTNGEGYGAKVRVYGCKVYQNGVLVRDFIPVRVGQVGYLYDRVTGKLFGNQGEGAFILGADVLESTAKSYVQDGLVAMWDGIENARWGVRDDSATVWVDLVGGREALLNGSAYFDKKSVVLPAPLDYVSYKGTLLSTEYTVEVIVLRDETQKNAYPSVFGGNGDAFSLFFDSKNSEKWTFKQPYTTNRPRTETRGLNKPLVILCKKNEFYFRYQDPSLGMSQIVNKESQGGYNTTWTFGGSVSTNYICGNLYRFAFYDRVLTDEEIAYNYNIDKARFGL